MNYTLHGLTPTASDLQDILRLNGYKGTRHVDDSIYRNVIARNTVISLRHATSRDSEHARSILDGEKFNGSLIRSRSTHKMLNKYDPLYESNESGPGMVVSIEGLPYSMREEHMEQALRGYELVENPDLRYEPRSKPVNDSSSWLVRLKSEDEAQRLVQDINCTYYLPKRYGQDYQLKAEVLY